MVSSVKNFFLTFVLALVLFGLIASVILNLVINNLNGVIAQDNGVGSSGIDTARQDDRPDVTTDSTFSVLVIGSDFREGVYADYDAAQLEKLFGIRKKTMQPPMAPADLMVPSARQARSVFSNKDLEKNVWSVSEDGQLIIPGGFYSVKTRSVEADVAVVVTFNFDKKWVEYVPVSIDREIDVKGGKLAVSEILGKYGIDVFCEAVRSEFNLPFDRYLFLAAKDFPAFMNTFGKVTFSLPFDMQCDDFMRDVHVDFKAGLGEYDGAAALNLLMFEDYTEPGQSRQNTTAEFIRAFLGMAFSSANASGVPAKAKQVKSLVKTNLTSEDLNKYLSRMAVCASLGT